MEDEGFYIILTLIGNHYVSEAVYLVENNEDLGDFLNDPDELFEISGVLAEQGCHESVEIYDMAEEHIEEYNDRHVALYEITIFLVNLSKFDRALRCAYLIQPDLFGDRDKILDFTEKKKAGKSVLDKPDLELWYTPDKIPQALAASQKGIFIGNNGAFKNTGLKRNLSEYLSQATSWYIGLETIERGLSIKVIQEIIRIMAWNDDFWLTVHEILEPTAN